MPLANPPIPPKFISSNPGGQHVLVKPAHLDELVLRMDGISEVKPAYDIYKPTPAMAELASHLDRLSRTPEEDLCYNHACCDISDAWNQIGAAGKAQVYSGVSAKGGTLVLLFAPIHEHCDYIVEINCRY